MQGVEGTGSRAERNRKWRERHPGAQLKATNAWRALHPGYVGPKRQAIADKVAAIKEATPCSDCGAKFPACCMDFDHRGTDKRREVGILISRSADWEVVLEEIEKCDLVCANCHRIRTRDKGSAGWARKTLDKDKEWKGKQAA